MAQKGYIGLPMEGPIASWYTKNTGRDLRRFVKIAQAVVHRVAPGGRVLEVAPGPGFCAIEIAKSGRYSVTGLDISESFVRIARENAARNTIAVDFRHGNASKMPFPDASFDFVVCTAAFKNFSEPIPALNEIHRVLTPGGQASIYDLRKDASRDEIATEVRNMQLSLMSSLLTRWTFRFVLLKRAYTRVALEEMAAESRFGMCDIVVDGIGFELQLAKQSQAQASARPSNLGVLGGEAGLLGACSGSQPRS
jgi:ubiquinone/menaquinone biosynthesis C-methylase UbiE